MTGIYDQPEMYEAACAYRDVPGDVTALLRWWQRHGPGTGLPGSVLELAAGPAEHSRELAGRQLADGSRIAATALDLSPAMSGYARDRAAGRLSVVTADMRDFVIEGARFDLVITMLNSLCHLMTLEDMTAHLGAVARHLVPGGLYVIELAHPADVLTPASRTSSEWTTELDDGTVTVRWGGPGDRIDPVTQVMREHVAVRWRHADGRTQTVTDVVPNRFWTGTEMEAAIRLAGGLQVAARYGDFDEDLPLSDRNAWRLILVLRRTGPAPGRPR